MTHWTPVEKGLPPSGKQVELVCELTNIETRVKCRVVATGKFYPSKGWDVFNYRIDGHTYYGVIAWKEIDKETNSVLSFDPQPGG